MDVRWRMFPLHTETPTEGISLEQLFHTDSERISQMVAQLAETARSLGLPFGDRHMTYNSRKAQELGIWADETGHGNAFHMAAFTAYFAKGKNLAQLEVLLDIATQAGLERDEAAKVLEEQRFAEAVDNDWQLARTMGIQAAPTFVMNDNRLVGAQPYPALRDFVLQNSAGLTL